MARASAFALLALSMALPAMALGEQAVDPLDRAHVLMSRQEYEQARTALEEALGRGGLLPSDLGELYRMQAEAAAALRLPVEAERAFVLLLAITPDYYVATGESPLVREPFEAASRFWRGKRRPALSYRPPPAHARGEPLVVEPSVERGALPDLVTEVTLHVQRPDGTFETRAAADGRVIVGVEELASSDEVRFYLAARDVTGNAVVLVGSPDAPLEVALVSAVEEQDERRERDGRRWYRSWWFWTTVGAVVAGLAVGLPLGLTADSGSPCERAFGSPCDLTLSFGD